MAEQGNVAGAAARGRFPYPLLAALALLIAAAVQIWLISGGSWTHWPTTSRCYSQMADSFLSGRLSLVSEPTPQNPHPPDAFTFDPHWYYAPVDTSLFRGKYYYYWGPVPALLAAAVCRLLGIAHPTFGDQYLYFAFSAGTVFFAAVLMTRIRRKYFPDQPPSISLTAILSLALGTPLLYHFSNPQIYEAAVVAGQFFLLAGLCAAWSGLQHRDCRRLALAAACWAMSMGSRVSLPPAVSLLAALTWWPFRRDAAKWKAAASLLLPLAAGAIALAIYNHARFSSIFESGETYQISRKDHQDMIVSGFIAPVNVPRNLTLYLLMPPHRFSGFPYILAVARQKWLGGYFAVSWRSIAEPVVGLIWTQPFLALGFFALLVPPNQDPMRSWIIRCLCLGSLMALAGPLVIDYTAMRYTLDGLPMLSVLALVGYGSLLQRLSGHPKLSGELRAAVWTLVIVQSVIAFLLAVGRNTDLAHHLAAHLPIL